jgi:hypothetical protein
VRYFVHEGRRVVRFSDANGTKAAGISLDARHENNDTATISPALTALAVARAISTVKTAGEALAFRRLDRRSDEKSLRSGLSAPCGSMCHLRRFLSEHRLAART